MPLGRAPAGRCWPGSAVGSRSSYGFHCMPSRPAPESLRPRPPIRTTGGRSPARRPAGRPVRWPRSSRAWDGGRWDWAGSRCADRSWPAGWLPSLLVIERITASRSATVATAGQCSANRIPGTVVANGLGAAAVGMALERAEGLELRGAALHPEQDAGLVPLPQVGGVGGDDLAEGQHAGGEAGRRQQAQELSRRIYIGRRAPARPGWRGHQAAGRRRRPARYLRWMNSALLTSAQKMSSKASARSPRVADMLDADGDLLGRGMAGERPQVELVGQFAIVGRLGEQPAQRACNRRSPSIARASGWLFISSSACGIEPSISSRGRPGS